MAGRVWPARDAWLTRGIYIIYHTHSIGYRTYKPILRTGYPFISLPYLTAFCSFISSVWDYVPHGLIRRMTWRTGSARVARAEAAQGAPSGREATWAPYGAPRGAEREEI